MMVLTPQTTSKPQKGIKYSLRINYTHNSLTPQKTSKTQKGTNTRKGQVHT